MLDASLAIRGQDVEPPMHGTLTPLMGRLSWSSRVTIPHHVQPRTVFKKLEKHPKLNKENGSTKSSPRMGREGYAPKHRPTTENPHQARRTMGSKAAQRRRRMPTPDIGPDQHTADTPGFEPRRTELESAALPVELDVYVLGRVATSSEAL
jgi:hypothetical protein